MPEVHVEDTSSDKILSDGEKSDKIEELRKLIEGKPEAQDKTNLV